MEDEEMVIAIIQLLAEEKIVEGGVNLCIPFTERTQGVKK